MLERILEIEYIRVVTPRKEEDPSLHDDWVIAVDGFSSRSETFFAMDNNGSATFVPKWKISALYQNCVDEKPYAIKWSTAPDSRYFLQRVIRQEFSECTVINVAHRVPTVIGSDMVMVLSYGKLVEYDEPSKLMEDQSSSFSKLVVEYWSSCSRISL
ncbi:hypothetical protein Fmac_011728 [Flemingia macrophylla]|uniref:Uncharacterized protein n=1 Tax=Flemingia macrophylla TaxID=520843 RepID=A0ABD1MNB3_9FABA